MGRTHLSIGLLLLFVLARFTDLIQGREFEAAALILLASILPDIDSARSIIGKKFRKVQWLFRHRGFFHSLFAMVMFTVIVQVVTMDRNLSMVFLAGYASHLLADSVTREGTKLFYPKEMKIKGPLLVGSFAETLVFLLLVVLVLYLLF